MLCTLADSLKPREPYRLILDSQGSGDAVRVTDGNVDPGGDTIAAGRNGTDRPSSGPLMLEREPEFVFGFYHGIFSVVTVTGRASRNSRRASGLTSARSRTRDWKRFLRMATHWGAVIVER